MLGTTEGYLDGDVLYGDDFDPGQIERWFADEAEAYYEMSAHAAADARPHGYGYAEQSRLGLFRHLPVGRRFGHALAFGGSDGSELGAIAGRIDRLTILESSENYRRDPRLRMPIASLLADPSGTIDLPDGSVDLISCFDVLHHIPNVSHVLTELARVLAPDGVLLVREPITSMGGNWDGPRPGLTPHERGIPITYFRDRIARAGLAVEEETLMTFPPILMLWKRTGRPPYNSPVLARLDLVLCRLLRARIRYHARTRLEKVRPTELGLVLRRA